MLPVVHKERTSILERLRCGAACHSLGIRSARNLDFVRMAASAGYDLIWVDLEHSTIALDSAAQMCALAGDLGLGAWVRIPEGDFGVIGRILDGGASGLIIPHIVTANDAREAASYCRYPPAGGRSHNALTSTFGFRRIPGAERVALANGHVTLQVLLETPEAVANADAIAAVDGVDVIGLGLNDLSAGMGLLGEVQHPAVTDLCRQAIAAAHRHGKIAVIGGVAGPEHYASLVAMGAAPFVFTAIDTDLFVEALSLRLEKWRAFARA